MLVVDLYQFYNKVSNKNQRKNSFIQWHKQQENYCLFLTLLYFDYGFYLMFKLVYNRRKLMFGQKLQNPFLKPSLLDRPVSQNRNFYESNVTQFAQPFRTNNYYRQPEVSTYNRPSLNYSNSANSYSNYMDSGSKVPKRDYDFGDNQNIQQMLSNNPFTRNTNKSSAPLKGYDFSRDNMNNYGSLCTDDKLQYGYVPINKQKYSGNASNNLQPYKSNKYIHNNYDSFPLRNQNNFKTSNYDANSDSSSAFTYINKIYETEEKPTQTHKISNPFNRKNLLANSNIESIPESRGSSAYDSAAKRYISDKFQANYNIVSNAINSNNHQQKNIIKKTNNYLIEQYDYGLSKNGYQQPSYKKIQQKKYNYDEYPQDKYKEYDTKYNYGRQKQEQNIPYVYKKQQDYGPNSFKNMHQYERQEFSNIPKESYMEKFNFDEKSEEYEPYQFNQRYKYKDEPIQKKIQKKEYDEAEIAQLLRKCEEQKFKDYEPQKFEDSKYNFDEKQPSIFGSKKVLDQRQTFNPNRDVISNVNIYEKNQKKFEEYQNPHQSKYNTNNYGKSYGLDEEDYSPKNLSKKQIKSQNKIVKFDDNEEEEDELKREKYQVYSNQNHKNDKRLESRSKIETQKMHAPTQDLHNEQYPKILQVRGMLFHRVEMSD